MQSGCSESQARSRQARSRQADTMQRSVRQRQPGGCRSIEADSHMQDPPGGILNPPKPTWRNNPKPTWRNKPKPTWRNYLGILEVELCQLCQAGQGLHRNAIHSSRSSCAFVSSSGGRLRADQKEMSGTSYCRRHFPGSDKAVTHACNACNACSMNETLMLMQESSAQG